MDVLGRQEIGSGLRRERCAIPEGEFGFAAAVKAGADSGAAVIPLQNLLARASVVALVQFAQQRGAGQAAFAQVVDEVYERIELVLAERHLHVPFYGLLGSCHVGCEQLFGSGLVDPLRE
jgi:hypothetical protein